MSAGLVGSSRAELGAATERRRSFRRRAERASGAEDRHVAPVLRARDPSQTGAGGRGRRPALPRIAGAPATEQGPGDARASRDRTVRPGAPPRADASRRPDRRRPPSPGPRSSATGAGQRAQPPRRAGRGRSARASRRATRARAAPPRPRRSRRPSSPIGRSARAEACSGHSRNRRRSNRVRPRRARRPAARGGRRGPVELGDDARPDPGAERAPQLAERWELAYATAVRPPSDAPSAAARRSRAAAGMTAQAASSSWRASGGRARTISDGSHLVGAVGLEQVEQRAHDRRRALAPRR